MAAASGAGNPKHDTAFRAAAQRTPAPMAIGFRILKRRRAVSAAFRKLPVANISDNMSRMTAGGARLRPMHAGGVMAGPAFTVRTRPGDNLMVHKALDMAAPGDIIVVDAGGDLTNAIIGEIMTTYAEKRGIGGIVINGSIRDAGTLRASAFPVYAAGVTHRGPYKDGPGEINVPIAIDGMTIEPGDLVIGDEDGLLAVPFDACAAVLAATEAKHAAEIKQLAEIAAGKADRAWVDATLAKLGCEIER
jgi:RraA family protein